MYALVDYLGKQIKVEPKTEVKVPLTSGDIGDKITLDKVLFLDDGKEIKIGKPTIEGASINAKIVSHGRERKVIVFKFKRRKGYQKKQGHRQDYSILSIGTFGSKKTVKKATTKKVATKKTTEKKD
jgi:large subunit ribosomal protein L21